MNAADANATLASAEVCAVLDTIIRLTRLLKLDRVTFFESSAVSAQRQQ